MTNIPDLSPCVYIPVPDTERLLAVGWLHPDCDYQRGQVDRDFVVSLFNLLRNPWQPVVAGGRHDCEFCVFSGGPHAFRLVGQNDEVHLGWANLFVPAGGGIYVAPSTIIHYIDAHQYCPPAEFQQAVMKCPAMRSMEYLKAILANGPKRLAAFAKPRPPRDRPEG